MLIPRMCQPIWDAFADVALVAGLMPLEGVVVEWQPPRFEMIDPLKEMAAAEMAVRNGFATWDQVVSGFGYDPPKQAAEIQAANERFDQRGIVLDCDPRRTSAAGLTQPRPAGTSDPNAPDLHESDQDRAFRERD